MSLVFCPECNKQISEHAENCQNCGFPIKKFIEDNNFTDFTKAFICPKCAKSYKHDDIPIQFKCEYCNSILVQTDMGRRELRSIGTLKINEEKFNNKTVELAKKFGDNQFDENVYNDRLKKLHQEVEKSIREADDYFAKKSQQQNAPKCPKCGSTAITAGQKGYSLLTGFLGSNKTVNRCANCGHTWRPGK